MNEKTVRLTHEMTNDDTAGLAAVTVILGLYIDVHLKKGCPVPSDVPHRAMLMARGIGDGRMA